MLQDLAARGLAADISFGYGQITVGTAKGLGIGDGATTVGNCLAVRVALFDRATAVDRTAAYLVWCWTAAGRYNLPLWGIGRELAALCIYNAGTLWPPADRWWQRWSGNVASYREALKWAEGIIG